MFQTLSWHNDASLKYKYVANIINGFCYKVLLLTKNEKEKKLYLFYLLLNYFIVFLKLN